jgi:hypothetical protein
VCATFNRFAIAAATFSLVTIVSGCASPSTQATLTGPNANQNGELQHGRLRAQPASSSYGDLLYVAPNGPNLVAYYTYPGAELVGTLNETGRGLCSDTSGDVFVVDGGVIDEYAHGGTNRINRLGGGSSYEYESCSVDPTTGNLAVTFDDGLSAPGIAIFKNAMGNQITFTDADFEHFYYCGYDGSGNLLADGFKEYDALAVAELPAGGSELKTIQLNKAIEKPGQVQWDGEYLTIEDEHNRLIYRVEIKGSAATVVGKTKLGGVARFFGSWIYGSTVIVPFTKKHGVHDIGFWNYPGGGSPTKTFTGPGYDTTDNAVTISPGS